MIQILGLLSVYFDAVVVEVETFLILFRLALVILCLLSSVVFVYILLPHESFCEGLTFVNLKRNQL